MQAKPSEKFDFFTSLASANTFHSVAKECLKDYKDTHSIPPTKVFASATNYGLAIELYLKTLIIMEGESNIHGHKLDDLYNKLSDETQKKLNKAYKSLDGETRHDALYIRASLENSNPTNSNNDPIRGTKLKQLLKNNNDIFVMYRYMFEQGRTRNWKYFYFEYGNFDLACEALKIVSNEFLDDKGKIRVRSI